MTAVPNEGALVKQKAMGLIARIGISALFIGGISYLMRDKLGAAVQTLQHGVIWGWFYAGIGLFFIAQILLTLRFYLLLRVQKIRVRFTDALNLTFTGLFFNLFLPSAIGGDLAKAYYIAQSSGSKLKATTCIIQDRLIGFVSMASLAITALIFSSGFFSKQDVGRMLAAAVVAVAFVVFFFSHKPFARQFSGLLVFIPHSAKGMLSELYHALHDYRHHKKVLLSGLGLSWLAQGLLVILHLFMSFGLGLSGSFGYYFLAVPLSCFVGMVPSIGGVGVREAGILFFLNRIMPAEKALALSLLVSAVIYGFSLASGVVYAIHGGLKKDQLELMEEAIRS